MGRHVPHNAAGNLNRSPIGAHSSGKYALYAATPESSSWQHFMDRVTHVLLQGDLIRSLHSDMEVSCDDAISKWVIIPFKVIAGHPRAGSIHAIYEMMGIKRCSFCRFLFFFVTSCMISVVGSADPSREFIFSCRTPLIHPYFSLKLR
jgi:hypothetical protein